MSHTMNIDLEIRDLDALATCAEKLGLRIETGIFSLFSSQETGTAIFLKDWSYPAIVRTDGTVAYDTYNGMWGDEARLHELTAHYGLEKAKIEARKKGYSVIESINEESQELELRIQIGG
jgi:hypothetical protein